MNHVNIYAKLYSRFFIPDYIWTHKNVENMRNQNEKFSRWTQSTKALLPHIKMPSGSMLLGDYIKILQQKTDKNLTKLDTDELIYLIFEQVVESVLIPDSDTPNTCSTSHENIIQESLKK